MYDSVSLHVKSMTTYLQYFLIFFKSRENIESYTNQFCRATIRIRKISDPNPLLSDPNPIRNVTIRSESDPK
jgi:hypothetical protein